MAEGTRRPSLLDGIARVLLCLVFIHAVIGKLTGFAGGLEAKAFLLDLERVD